MRLSTKKGIAVSAFRSVSSLGKHRRQPRHGRPLTVFTVAGVGSYISEAFMQIFSVSDDDKSIEWEQLAMPFSGRITHHEERRLRRLYDVVQAVKGCTDTSAKNYDADANIDDGSCEYNPGSEPIDLVTYLQGAVERVMHHQFKGDDTEPNWAISPFSGEIKSQREIEKMMWFETVVKKTLDEAEVDPKE